MRFDDLFTNFLTDTLDSTEDSQAQRKLFICTTPRTGGHTCCQHLMSLGLGLPTEYFNLQYAVPLMRRWTDSPDLSVEELGRRAEEYGRLLSRYRSANGVFSAKVFYENLLFLRDALGPDDDSWFWLRLVRNDKVAQTVSLLAMISTGRAFDSEDQRPELVTASSINRRSVINAVQHLHHSELGLSSGLASIPDGRKATIAFEDMVESPDRIIRGSVSQWFGELPEEKLSPTASKRYASDSALKQQIKEQFGELIAETWQNLPNPYF